MYHPLPQTDSPSFFFRYNFVFFFVCAKQTRDSFYFLFVNFGSFFTVSFLPRLGAGCEGSSSSSTLILMAEVRFGTNCNVVCFISGILIGFGTCGVSVVEGAP